MCRIAVSYLCAAPPECEEGSLRLMDGAIDNEGRVEICLEGVWGTVLSSSNWTSLEAHVACKQVNLGTSGKSEYTRKSDTYMQSNFNLTSCTLDNMA